MGWGKDPLAGELREAITFARAIGPRVHDRSQGFVVYKVGNGPTIYAAILGNFLELQGRHVDNERLMMDGSIVAGYTKRIYRGNHSLFVSRDYSEETERRLRRLVRGSWDDIRGASYATVRPAPDIHHFEAVEVLGLDDRESVDVEPPATAADQESLGSFARFLTDVYGSAGQGKEFRVLGTRASKRYDDAIVEKLREGGANVEILSADKNETLDPAKYIVVVTDLDPIRLGRLREEYGSHLAEWRAHRPSNELTEGGER